MHERKALMASLSAGFIALPGGFGTLDELAEALTWTQLGLQAKPVVLLDVDGFWVPLVQFFDAAVEHGFVRPAHRMLLQRTVTVDEAIALASGPSPRRRTSGWTATGPAEPSGRVAPASESRQTSDARRTPSVNAHEMVVS